jgi:hypothetical protein
MTFTALPITSAGRFSPLGTLGIKCAPTGTEMKISFSGPEDYLSLTSNSLLGVYDRLSTPTELTQHVW